jgi:deoxyribodipyrimidine photo-lyase
LPKPKPVRTSSRPRTAKSPAPNVPPTAQQQKDAEYARLGEEFRADPAIPAALRHLSDDPRVTVRRGGAPDPKGKCIVYWMQRAQRGMDNHALDKAVDVANALGLPVVAYFAGISNFPHGALRGYVFLNQGLPDIEEDCGTRGVGFLTRYAPHEDHLRFFADVHAAMVIGDENPMRAPEQWRVDIASKLRIPFWTVDADVIVPSKLLLKAQYSGAIARPRIMKALPHFLKPFTNPHASTPWKTPRGLLADDPRADMTKGWKDLDRSVGGVAAWQGGHHEAMRRLGVFVKDKLAKYADDRNHPEREATSRLSPYLHFGHIGPLTIALAIEAAVKKDPKLAKARDSYYNEVITWRELSVNFCRYQPDYDNPGCVDHWASETIAKHDRDKREVVYTLKQLEAAETYDDLWNAAQLQMVRFGWMPNYLRMLWGKKIVEWTPDVATAMKYLVYLNDKYFLDGRDPNGYSGIAWCALGKFDRPWPERPVFGKRRYMSSESAKRKFDAKRYMAEAKHDSEPGTEVAAMTKVDTPK